jgi:hypothetical protein
MSARVRAPYGGCSTRAQPCIDPAYRTIGLSADLIMPDRQHGGTKPAGAGQPSEPPCADQQQAFGFAQAL